MMQRSSPGAGANSSTLPPHEGSHPGEGKGGWGLGLQSGLGLELGSGLGLGLGLRVEFGLELGPGLELGYGQS